MELKEWVFNKPNKFLADEIRERYNISEIAANLLISRNLTEKSDIDSFLDDSPVVSDPFSFVGMEKLVKRLKTAIENFEKICIFGDYDSDGITSTAMFYKYLLSKGADVIYSLPSRYSGGYGLNADSVRKISSYGVKVILTVDNGISAKTEIEFANEIGMDVIVTDHHKPPKDLPDAVAIVNPHLNPGGFSDFAGVGVVFKIIEAMEQGKKNLSELIDEYGDFLAIGTIGDSVPLLGENRKLVKLGLKTIENTKKPGVKILAENCGFCGSLTSLDVTFGIVPKINACGRMGEPEAAVKLLLSKSSEEASELFSVLVNENDERKKVSNKIFGKAKVEISKTGAQFERIIFVWSEDWNHGIIGIVAANIMSKFGKPCVLFSIKDKEARASGRSIEGFDMHSAVSKCSSFLLRFGGHPMAVGLTLKSENLQKFKSEILDYVKDIEVPFPILKIEYLLEPSEISVKNLESIDVLKPFGSCNVEPVFGITEAKLIKIVSIGGGLHLKLTFLKDNKEFDAVLFGVSEIRFLHELGDTLDLAVRLRKNFYLGSVSVSIHILDLKFSDLDTSDAVRQKRDFEDFMSGNIKEDLSVLLPTRDEFIVVYNYVVRHSISYFRVDILSFRLKNYNIKLIKLYIILEVLNELGILKFSRTGDEYTIFGEKPKIKADLDKSRILENLKTCIQKA